MTAPHLPTSALTKSGNSVIPIFPGSAPWAVRDSINSGALSALSIASDNFWTISFGVFAGTKIPYQLSTL